MTTHLSPADRALTDYLRRHEAVSVSQLVDILGVTATAVRQRLNRLMADGLVERQLASVSNNGGGPDAATGEGEAEKTASRGRPSYCYLLTDRGRRDSGDNYSDLAQAMWHEIRAIPDPDVRIGLVKRLAAKLANRYADQIGGDDIAQRMRNLMRLMAEREVPVDVDESGALPVLTLLACPYPTLAEKDRSVCAMEKAMISEVLGETVKLSECRLDGGGCCSFEPSGTGQQEVEAVTN